MSEHSPLGTNRTGIQMAPVESAMLLQENEAVVDVPYENPAAASMRQSYIAESPDLGTVPVPATIKGMAKSGFEKFMGKNPEVFIDKLGQRLAFERTGTRLYSAIINKCIADPDSIVSLEVLKRIQQEEVDHFTLVHDAIVELGGDPTAMTPSADADAVASMGLLQLARDPRANLMQTLQAAHIAELTDNDGWEMLISLAREMGHENMAVRFEKALQEEQEHLAHTRRWMKELLMKEGPQLQ